jgi:hypothetical protein
MKSISTNGIINKLALNSVQNNRTCLNLKFVDSSRRVEISPEVNFAHNVPLGGVAEMGHVGVWSRPPDRLATGTDSRTFTSSHNAPIFTVLKRHEECRV